MKFSTLQFVSVISIIVLSGFVITSHSVLAASSPDPLTTQLLNVAQTKLDAEYNVLISGDSTKMTTSTASVNGSAAQKVNGVAAMQVRRNKMLAEHGQRYTKSSSKLTVKKSEILKDSAVVTAQEEVTLTLVDKNAKEPVLTKEIKEHVFHYARQGNQWRLTEDSQPVALAPVASEVGAEQVKQQPISLKLPIKPETKSEEKSTSMSIAALSGTYNANAAVNYALSYWNNYNSAYRAYGNDCTNFTSQALNWAGWQHVGGWYNDPNYWWYSNSPVVAWGGRSEARSWINVHDFYFFARYSGRGYNAGSLTDFRVGDTLQVDFGKPDGFLDHNTIVTKNNGNGNIFLTYHSVNTLNISIWDFIAQTPGANYYGTLFRSQY